MNCRFKLNSNVLRKFPASEEQVKVTIKGSLLETLTWLIFGHSRSLNLEAVSVLLPSSKVAAELREELSTGELVA